MSERKRAYEHLQVEGNYIQNEETGRSVERVNMAGGKYLAFDENGNVAGFKSFEECMDWVGIT